MKWFLVFGAISGGTLAHLFRKISKNVAKVEVVCCQFVSSKSHLENSFERLIRKRHLKFLDESFFFFWKTIWGVFAGNVSSPNQQQQAMAITEVAVYTFPPSTHPGLIWFWYFGKSFSKHEVSLSRDEQKSSALLREKQDTRYAASRTRWLVLLAVLLQAWFIFLVLGLFLESDAVGISS